MWLSTRGTFQEGDPGWTQYVKFIGLPGLKQVRSIDSSLNECVEAGSSGAPARDRQYQLLALEAEKEELTADAADARLLGYDLADETYTSSLLNCGPWKGQLAEFQDRLNEYGLLSREDAQRAKALLPQEWPDEPHAQVSMWALFEVVRR